ncbi:LacI family DNA-binding transcriptional regulator [Paraflavisolibacter sp. H34]|uniref:LacI family DNA-binding transcriptional regulator n=1 Tax=Huijunlia imazamoxiresistens TaxID=3127457 RepID=UPI00301777E7
MKSHQITIVDIAQRLNVSKSTVSRALTGHPSVKEQTRKAVLELAEELDYQRNISSISLITNKTQTIGIIVPEFITSFFPRFVIAAQEVATQAGYNVLISQCNETYETEVANAKAMLTNRVDGILVSLSKETRNFDHFKAFQKKGIPIVFFNRVCEDMMVPKVVVDDHDAAFKAVEHLIATGKKRIAHLAGPDSLAISRKRHLGYKDALKKYNLPYDEDLVIASDLTLSKIRIYVKHLLDQDNPPDGLFAFNDPTAIEAIQSIKQMGRRIPEDIAVVGFSDNYASSFIEPSLTTIAQPVDEMGQVAMKLLLDLMDKDVSKWKPIVKILNTKLMVRNSTVRG